MSHLSSTDTVKFLISIGFWYQDAHRDADGAKPDLYSRFSITGKEISAFVVDRDFHWFEIPSLASMSSQACEVSHDYDSDSGQSKFGGVILPVLDRCGMSLVLDQVPLRWPLASVLQ